ncbi:MAG: hypothetical protein KKC54_04255 [Nanoarchaeota archaeon]|nr:hypothetical protein [Nanoarchaeota archaeon]
MLVLLGLALIAAVIIFFIMAKGSSTYVKSTSCDSVGGKCVKAVDCEGKQSFMQGCKKEEICCLNEIG